MDATFAERVFFCNSGAEANEAAIKIVRKHASEAGRGPEEREIITFEGSFHGRTLATVTATAQPKYQRGVRTASGRVHILPVQRSGGDRGRDLRPHLCGDAGAGAGRRRCDTGPAGLPPPPSGPLPPARCPAGARRDSIRDGSQREVLRPRMGARHRAGRGHHGEGARRGSSHGGGARRGAGGGCALGGHARFDVRRKSRCGGRGAGRRRSRRLGRSPRERRPTGRCVPALSEPRIDSELGLFTDVRGKGPPHRGGSSARRTRARPGPSWMPARTRGA